MLSGSPIHLYRPDRDDHAELQERLHTALWRSVTQAGDCWPCPLSHSANGVPRLWVYGKMWPAARIAAWLWLEAFDLFDSTVRIVRAAECAYPKSCISPDHLSVVHARRNRLRIAA